PIRIYRQSLMSHSITLYFSVSSSFTVALFQQAGAAYSIAIAGGLNGVHCSSLDVAIDRPPVDVDDLHSLRLPSARLSCMFLSDSRRSSSGDAGQFVRIHVAEDKSQITGATYVFTLLSPSVHLRHRRARRRVVSADKHVSAHARAA